MSAAAIRLDRLKPGGGLAREVKARSGASPMSCLQCAKCTSGCPVAARADVRPHELVRLVQLDQRRTAQECRFIWECTSCQTCTTRCPQQVDLAAMNDALRALSVAEGRTAAGTAVPTFNRVFLASVRKRGRTHELGLMAAFKLRTLRLFADMGKAPMMFAKGKLSLFGPRIPGKAGRQAMFLRAVGGKRP
jgi:heterodisulfide reductase subunit C